jgi:hypothetical protein
MTGKCKGLPYFPLQISKTQQVDKKQHFMGTADKWVKYWP